MRHPRVPASASERWVFAFIAGAALLLQACGLVQSGAQAAADGNLLSNPGFEEQAAGLPAAWQPEKRAAHKGSVSVAANAARSGNVLRLQPNAKNRDEEKYDSPLSVGQGFSADAVRGKRLYVSAWLAADGNAVAVVGLYAFRKDGKVLGVRLTRPAGAAGFGHQEDVLEIPDDRNTQFVVLVCAVEGQQGSALFDDVYLGTQPAPAARAPAAPAAAQSLNARIEVDAAKDLRAIPRTLYGTNIEWIWDANGLWNRKRQALDQDLVGLTRDLGTTLLRFPGGIFADFYHWRDGVGPRQSRPQTQHFPGGPKSQHLFGTDEALEFARAVGAPLMITVNIATGTPQEAAEWVRHVNAGGTSVKGAPRVDLWEVGNENYIKGDAEYLKGTSFTPRTYATRFLEFAKAMRAADGKIRLAAIAEENFPHDSQPLHANWTEELLRAAGDQVDYVAIHNAYAPMLVVDKGWDVETVYAGMLAAPLLIEQSLDRVSRTIARAAPSRADKIKIAVTEWGPSFDVRPTSRYVDHVKTLGSALYAADVLRVLLQAHSVEIANFFKLNDQLFMGWLGPRNGVFIPKAPYYALQMYTRHFGDVVVASTTSAPTYDSPAVGWVDAVPGVPYLSAIASRSTDARTLYVMVINKHLEQPIKVNLALRGFRPSGKTTAWVLSGSGVDANTGTELFQAPGITWPKQAAARRNPRFEQGRPGEVEIKRSSIDLAGAGGDYTAPAHSVSVLEIPGGR